MCALRQFNKHKTHINRINLANKKSAYNSYEANLKRQHRRQEGDMLQTLKRTNPKRFFELFRKRNTKIQTCQLMISIGIFSDFMSNMQQIGAVDLNIEYSDSVCEDLDQEFCLKGIHDQIHNLKINKSPGTDNLVNELFILCEDILYPVLLKLFNQILSTGVFPET